MHWGRFLRETPFYIDKHRHAHSNTLAMLSHLTLLTSVPEKNKKKKENDSPSGTYSRYDVILMQVAPKKGMKSGSYETPP